MVITEDATVSSKGRVTIPKRIRDELGIERGTEVEFIIEDEGTVRVCPKQPAMDRPRDVKATLTKHDIDVEALRRESKAAWS